MKIVTILYLKVSEIERKSYPIRKLIIIYIFIKKINYIGLCVYFYQITKLLFFENYNNIIFSGVIWALI